MAELYLVNTLSGPASESGTYSTSRNALQDTVASNDGRWDESAIAVAEWEYQDGTRASADAWAQFLDDVQEALDSVPGPVSWRRPA